MAANQEHGIISGGLADKDIAGRFPIGSLLRILPNHACATGAQHSEYQMVDGRGQISRWGRFSGW